MQSTGAILEGHFQLTSGRHSDVYLEKFRLLERPEIVEEIGHLMAKVFNEEEIDVVLGVAVGGILLSHSTAKVLGVHGIFAERVNGKLALRRGFFLNAEDRVLIVEDIVTTGGSIKELLGLVEEYGAHIVGVVYLVERNREDVDFGYPSKPLMRYPAVSWDSDSCPLCQKGIPVKSRGRTGKNENSKL